MALSFLLASTLVLDSSLLYLLTRALLPSQLLQRRMIPLVQAVRMVGQEVQEVKGAMENDKYERHEREKKNKAARSDLQYLLEEARIARVHGDAIRSLGVPLAEIAAFMHEVELWLPQVEGTKMSMSEKSRVEELRIIALRLQNLPSGQQRSDLQKTILDKLAEIR
ncbi:hypothetical protein BT96DRAFT_934530 [Gymnopus androsaceus JB14]|uniref:Uncharacterized protein n=1 Tax=Gymnopus androsaceus JB14 TaxID=1447944 RepID=A0A6A4I872_9AGAR|nr:hypothetical protein BT96DRAFT_934530 [Gymnopus androsaceus JB14]